MNLPGRGYVSNILTSSEFEWPKTFQRSQMENFRKSWGQKA